MSFFAVQNNKSKGKSGKGQTGRKIVHGKMDPCAITFIEKPSDLDKNFVACTEIACRFEKDGRVLQEGQQQYSVCRTRGVNGQRRLCFTMAMSQDDITYSQLCGPQTDVSLHAGP